ncbi:MAG: redoxin domain-containing protein [Candidatus Hydrogenedentales bacterium]|jgi:peroxiredoxin
MNKWVALGIAVVILVGIAAAVYIPLKLSGAFSKIPVTVRIGEPMPDFRCSDYNDKVHTLKQYEGKVVVLVFCSQKCPFSLGIEQQLSALVQFYQPNEKLVFLGIDSHMGTTTAEIKNHAQTMALPYPILKDNDAFYADATGARVTPEIFIIDKKGILAYRGAFDNRLLPERPGSIPYTAQAIEALLSDLLVNPTEVTAWGCTIKR